MQVYSRITFIEGLTVNKVIHLCVRHILPNTNLKKLLVDVKCRLVTLVKLIDKFYISQLEVAWLSIRAKCKQPH